MTPLEVQRQWFERLLAEAEDTLRFCYVTYELTNNPQGKKNLQKMIRQKQMERDMIKVKFDAICYALQNLN